MHREEMTSLFPNNLTIFGTLFYKHINGSDSKYASQNVFKCTS